MPSTPRRPTLWGAIEYLIPVARAALARRRKAARLRTEVEADQRVLDGVLQDIGRIVRQERIEGPGLAEELSRVSVEEERRAGASRGLEELVAERQREMARREVEERDLREELARCQSAQEALEGQARARNDERTALHVQRDAAQDEARAVRRRGEEPSEAMHARQRDIDTKLEALAAPIARIEDELERARDAVASQRRKEEEAVRAHRRTLSSIDERRTRCEREISGAERELSQRFVAIGTLVNLNRVSHRRLEPLYGRVDQLRTAITGREATIARLETELRAFDRGAVQRGLLVVGGALAIVVAVSIVLLVLLAR